MKARILLVVLVVLALLTALLSGCLFGGSKSDEGGEGASAGPDGAAPAAKDAGGPPAGGPGGPEAGGPPAGGPGGPEAGGPPAGGPGGPPGAEAGAPPAGGPGGPEADAPPAGGPGGPGGPEAGGAAAPAGATSRDGIDAKHAGKYDEALAIFETNLKTDPKDQLALRGKAWILAEQGKKAEAVPVFEQFIAASKDAKQVKEAKSAIARLK